MITFFKNNKLLSILIFITIISFIMGLLLPAFLSKRDINMITNNIQKTIGIYKKNSFNNYSFGKLLFQLFLSTSIIWILGLSVIGLPIILLLYSFKVYIVGAEISFLLYQYKLSKIVFIFFYILPKIVECLFFFYLVYYAVNFSILLIKLLFLNVSIQIKRIMKKYLIILFVVLLFLILLVTLEVFLLPKVLACFV